jgi:predicted ArsR family transcriptional regulator
MKPTARQILLLLAAEEISRNASNQKWADRLGCSSRTFTRHLADLAAAGKVTIERRSPNLDGPGTDPTGRTIRITEAGLSTVNTSSPEHSDTTTQP